MVNILRQSARYIALIALSSQAFSEVVLTGDNRYFYEAGQDINDQSYTINSNPDTDYSYWGQQDSSISTNAFYVNEEVHAYNEFIYDYESFYPRYVQRSLFEFTFTVISETVLNFSGSLIASDPEGQNYGTATLNLYKNGQSIFSASSNDGIFLDGPLVASGVFSDILDTGDYRLSIYAESYAAAGTAGMFIDGTFSDVVIDPPEEPVGPPVPVPAAAWLFGSALIGLAGFKRRS